MHEIIYVSNIKSIWIHLTVVQDETYAKCGYKKVQKPLLVKWAMPAWPLPYPYLYLSPVWCAWLWTWISQTLAAALGRTHQFTLRFLQQSFCMDGYIILCKLICQEDLVSIYMFCFQLFSTLITLLIICKLFLIILSIFSWSF